MNGILRSVVMVAMLCALPMPAFAQTIIRTQAQLNAFPPEQKIFTGNLYIRSADITDLTPLKNLEVITGLMRVESTNVVTTAGLDNLVSAGAIHFRFNPKLRRISGMNNLTTVGSFHAFNNYGITDIDGLNTLRQIQYIRIWDNYAMTTISGLKNLENITAGFLLLRNYGLLSITGMQNVILMSHTDIADNTNLRKCALYNILSGATVNNFNYNNDHTTTVAEILAAGPCQDAFVFTLQFTDEAGDPVGGVLCRMWAPGTKVAKVLSSAEMQLLWGLYPYNALFQHANEGLGGTHIFRFTAPTGWEFVGPDSLLLDVPPAADFYATEEHRFILRKTETTPAPDDSGAVEPPQPASWPHPLQFVAGSPAWHSQPWSHAVDEDVVGWDGTATVQADESGKTWAIFKFSNEQQHKFNYFTLQTDNGADDDACADRQPYQVEVSTSTTGADPADFTSLGLYRIKSPQMSFYKIGKEVTAKYVMLRLYTVPGAKHGWQQMVEFGLSWNKTSAAQPAGEALTVQTLPEGFALEPAFPNPFNPETTIRYQLGEEAHVLLRVFNLAGQEVARLADGEETAGSHAVRWQAGHLPSGVYVVMLSAGEHTAVQRIALLK